MHQHDNPQGEDQHANSDWRGIPIFIDEVKYAVPSQQMTGAALRALPQPPIGPELDLWLETPGPKDDVLIRPDETYQVRVASKFYTAPSTINPGEGNNVDS